MKNRQELPRLKDSISYIYLEHAIIEQSDSAIVAIRQDGKIPVPVAALTCLLLGPGISITHAAIRAICDNGCMAIWCGEGVGRFYAAGIGETASAANLLKQAEVCMDEKLHLAAVRRMYELRFPKMDTSNYTLQQIRGMEGIRVRKAYELAAKTSGVSWKKRSYKTESWDEADPINRALSEANALLYGLCHAAIVSLGYSAGLGFVHTGKQLSFVYDIADLYKAETTIPAAFEAVRITKEENELARNVRIQCRNRFSALKVLSRIPEDIAYILDTGKAEAEDITGVGDLWTEDGDTEAGGINYGGKETL